jgi:hypothetical protein
LSITANVKRLLAEIPPGVLLVAVAKGARPGDILEAVEAGIEIVGENYVQEAERAIPSIGNKVSWHFIGHLQKNKVKKAVELFDMIETVDSIVIAGEIDSRSRAVGKIMPVLVEINSGREAQKTGVLPEQAEPLIREISVLKNIRVKGLMTMGPRAGDPEDCYPYFVQTRTLFEKLKTLNIAGVEMKYLSMGMTNSYRVALREGANIVRIGTGIFGARC